MRAILVIAWKDLKALLTAPTLYIIATFCTALWSYGFMRNIMQFAERSMMSGGAADAEGGLNMHMTVFLFHISQINLLFIFVIPALTMRLIAEEKKLRTYDLLLTSPLTSTQIVVGKFLAGFGAAAFLTTLSFIYPLATAAVANIQFGPLFTSYLGVLLVAAAYVAVGLFASSLTESVVLSVCMGLIFNLCLWFISQGADFSNSPAFMSVMEHISIGQHFMSFIKGSIKLASSVFLLSLVGLFVFLTQRVVEASRWR